MSESCKVGRCVFVFRVGYDRLPMSEFLRVSNVGFGIGCSLAENCLVGGLFFGGNELFFVIDISSFFAIASAEDDLFVFVEFSRDGIDD